MQHQKAWKPHHIFVPVHKATTRGGVGCGAEVDEARALEKCSMVGAQPVHLVIQLLYDLLWENHTSPFTHEKKQKTEGRCSDLKRDAVWCHWESGVTTIYWGKRQRAARGAAVPEWGWGSNTIFFTDTEDSQSSVFVGQVFPLKIKWMEILISALTVLGSSLSPDSSAQVPFCPLQRQGSGLWLPCCQDHHEPLHFLIQHLPVFKACRLFNLLFNSPQTCNNQKVKQALQRLLTPLLLYIKTAQEIKKYLQNSQTPTCFSLFKFP